MASITTRTTSKGEKRYSVHYRLEGKPVEKWCRTLAEARNVKTTVENDLLLGTAVHPRAGAVRLSTYFETWITTRLVRGRPLTRATSTGYRRLWARNVAETVGKKELRAIHVDDVRTWHAGVVRHAGTDQAAKSYRLVHAVLETASADGLIRAGNPARIRGASQERATERPLVGPEVVLDIADAIDPALHALVMLAGFGGLRAGELLGLHRGDIDLLHRTVTIRRQAQEIGGRIEVDPKSDAGRRTISISADVVASLREHLDTYTGLDADAVVFVGPSGGPLRRAFLSQEFRAACARVGAPEGLHVHDLRHAAATMTAQVPGITTKELMARIGHSSPAAALRYQHATAERDQVVADALDDRITAARSARPTRAKVARIR